jgi:hypothetical protein
MSSAKHMERMIGAAIRGQGINALLKIGNFEAFDRYAEFIERIHQRAMESLDFPIDLQNIAIMEEEFNLETNLFFQGMGAAQDIDGSDIPFASLFGSERIGRTELLIPLAAKYICMFAATWKALNVTQNAIGPDKEIDAKLMKFRQRSVASVI